VHENLLVLPIYILPAFKCVSTVSHNNPIGKLFQASTILLVKYNLRKSHLKRALKILRSLHRVANLCHCQFVLMFSNIHFFLGPLLIGTPFPWRFVFCSWLSLSMGLGWTRHPPNCCWPSWHSGGNGWAAPIAGYFTEEPILTAYSARLTYYTLSSDLWKRRFSMQVSDSFCDCHRVLHLR